MNTLDIVLHQTLLSVGMSLCSLDDTFVQQDSMLQLSLQLLANELLYKDSHFAIACLMSINVIETLVLYCDLMCFLTLFSTTILIISALYFHLRVGSLMKFLSLFAVFTFTCNLQIQQITGWIKNITIPE